MYKSFLFSIVFVGVGISQLEAMKTPLEPLHLPEARLKSPVERRTFESRRDKDVMRRFERDRIFFLLDSYLLRTANVG